MHDAKNFTRLYQYMMIEQLVLKLILYSLVNY